MTRQIGLLATAFIPFALACGGGGGDSTTTGPGPGPGTGSGPTIDHIVMSATTATIQVGQNVTLTATAVAADGSTIAGTAAWSSASTSIASVSTSGVVTGVAAGTADITATIGGKQGHTAVTVTAQPTQVTGFVDLSISRSLWTTCAATGTNQGYCWGGGESGQVGDGNTGDVSASTRVIGSLSFAQVVAGDPHSCGRTPSGDVYCWGNLHFGVGPAETYLSPHAVSTGLGFTTLSESDADICGLNAAGTAYCWGLNGKGASGDGTTTLHQTPVAVSGGLIFSQITVGGEFSCGRTTAGVGYCWGKNDLGQLGDGTTTNRLVPTKISGNLTFAFISAGLQDVCAVTTAGAIYCWGTALGVIPAAGGVSNVPVRVTPDNAFAQVAAGVAHACALTPNGAAWCWGANDHNELGTGSSSGTQSSPVAVSGGLVFTKIAAGQWYSCAVTGAGTVYCWGYNGSGNLGNGTGLSAAVPTLVK